MRTKAMFVAGLMLLSSGTAVRAQEPQAPTFSVGDARVNGSFLKPYDNVWLYKVTLADGRVVPQGLWSDHVQVTKVDTVQALLRVQGLTMTNGRSKSTVNVFDPVTMKPLWSETHGPDGSVFRREFHGTHVTSKGQLPGSVPAIAEEQEKIREFDLTAPVFDFNGGMYGMLLVTMPLKAGMTGTFPTIEESEDKAAVDSYKVLREEEVKAGSRGTVRAWVVESEREGQYKMTFWLTKSAPYVIRLVYTTPVKDSPVFTWEMI